MKKILLPFIGLLTVILSSFVNNTDGQPVLFKFAPASSSITWTSTAEDGTSHTGTIPVKSGNLKFDSKILLSGYAYINMQKITCSDIEDEGFNRELILDMRSEEQLNLKKYKEATLKITKAKRLDVPDGQPNYNVFATLKLKGISIPVEFKALINKSKKEASIKGSFTVEKDKANLPYDMKFDLSGKAKIVK